MTDQTIVLQMNKEQLTKLDNYLIELPFKISNPIINFLQSCKIVENQVEKDNVVPITTEEE